MTEATPRPWQFVPAHIAEGDAEVRHPDGWLICTTPSDELAKRIVEAVNAYDDLKAENTRLRAALDEAVEVLRPFVTASHFFVSSIAPDGIDDGLTVIATMPSGHEAFLSSTDFHTARAFIERQKR